MPVGFQIDDLQFTSESLRAFPEEAAAIGRIVTTFSLIEGIVGGIYGLLTHQDIESAIVELKGLPTNARRVQAVRRLAAEVLEADRRQSVSDVLDRVLLYAERRNAITHGVWGTEHGNAEDLHRLDVKKWIPFLAGMIPAVANGLQEETFDTLRGQIHVFNQNTLLETEADGEALLTDIARVFTDLAAVVAQERGLPGEA